MRRPVLGAVVMLITGGLAVALHSPEAPPKRLFAFGPMQFYPFPEFTEVKPNYTRAHELPRGPSLIVGPGPSGAPGTIGPFQVSPRAWRRSWARR